MPKKKKIKFFTLYDTFTDEERKQFRTFISSPLFSQGRQYTKILSFIESDRSVFFEFGNSKKERTVWNRLSELTKFAERFLVLKATEAETPQYKTLLLSELKKRNLNDYFEKKIISLRTGLKDSLLTEMNMEEFLAVNKNYLAHLKSLPDTDRHSAEFQEINNYKFAFFMVEFLDYLIQLHDLKLFKSITTRTFLEDILLTLNFGGILSFINEKANEIYPLVAFHYYIYNSLKEPLNPIHYKKAIRIFENGLKHLPEEYRMKLYGYLMENKVELINRQETSAQTELFNLMKMKLKEGLCSDIQDRNFDSNRFRNYVLTGISLKKFKWTKIFIDEYGPKLPKEFRDESVILGKAFLMFGKREFTRSMELLNKLKKTMAYHYVDASLLKLKVCYELDEIDECHNEHRRLMEFLRGAHKVQDNFVKFTRDFCNSYSLLLKLNQNPTNNNLINLEVELNKGKLFGRRWIKEKINEIIVS